MKKLIAAVFVAALYSTAVLACHDKADTTASTKKETKKVAKKAPKAESKKKT